MVAWAILIQYLLLVKLFLTTLLTAMFSHTKAKVDAESDQIVILNQIVYFTIINIFNIYFKQWMFQRYEIVIDYEQRLRLPPPLTVISYVIMFFEWLCKRKNLVNVSSNRNLSWVKVSYFEDKIQFSTTNVNYIG